MMDKIRLLLVDDSISFLHNIAGFLAEFKDLTAENSDEALSLAADLHPDVVLLDVNMPGLSGIEITPHLRKILPEAGIIVLSFQNSDIYEEAALVAGADDFIPKDTLTYALIPAIHRVFQRSERLVSIE
ncbi:MAG: response regulator transcription factor [Anaerolineales bacterium]|nr:response regulator transcription factor [Anaerolineales bacterium]